MQVVLGSSVKETEVTRVLAEEGRRLEAKLQSRAEEESLLLQQLQVACDEVIEVEMALDAARSTSERLAAAEAERFLMADTEVAQLRRKLHELKGPAPEEQELVALADSVPWRRRVVDVCREVEEAYEWSGWTVWSKWDTSTLPAPLKDLADGKPCLFTDEAAEIVVDIDQASREDWVATEAWHPVSPWAYGETVDELLETGGEADENVASAERRQSAAAKAFGWPFRTVRRRKWEREVARSRIRGCGELANAVLRLRAEAATSQALCSKLVVQLDDLQRLKADADERAQKARHMDASIASMREQLEASLKGLRRLELLTVASKRTPVTPLGRKRPSSTSLSKQPSVDEDAPSEDDPPEDAAVVVQTQPDQQQGALTLRAVGNLLLRAAASPSAPVPPVEQPPPAPPLASTRSVDF